LPAKKAFAAALKTFQKMNPATECPHVGSSSLNLNFKSVFKHGICFHEKKVITAMKRKAKKRGELSPQGNYKLESSGGRVADFLNTDDLSHNRVSGRHALIMQFAHSVRHSSLRLHFIFIFELLLHFQITDFISVLTASIFLI
jgi:hypothetical protein